MGEMKLDAQLIHHDKWDRYRVTLTIEGCEHERNFSCDLDCNDRERKYRIYRVALELCRDAMTKNFPEYANP